MSRVMIVDDDPSILKFCDTVLSAQGHEAVLCQDPYKAVEILSTHQVDLLVVDVVMPVMSGLILLRTIKKFPHFHAPILMLTGKTSPTDVKAALEVGATDYMCKPFDKDVFLSKVRSLLSNQAEAPQVGFASTSANAKAEVSFRATIQSVSEMGMVLRTTGYVDRNLRVQVGTSLFQDVGIMPPALRAVSCKPIQGDPEFNYEVFVSFVGLDELTMRRIRVWIASRAVGARKVAADGY